MRIDDIAGFIRLIAPELERRLAHSAFAGYGGELTIAFYPNGLRLSFERGLLTAVIALPALSHREAAAAFPGRTFLNLLLGTRSVGELAYAFPGEAWARTEPARHLLDTLFPKTASAIWPVA